jgi:hypothetical protein
MAATCAHAHLLCVGALAINILKYILENVKFKMAATVTY